MILKIQLRTLWQSLIYKPLGIISRFTKCVHCVGLETMIGFRLHSQQLIAYLEGTNKQTATLEKDHHYHGIHEDTQSYSNAARTGFMQGGTSELSLVSSMCSILRKRSQSRGWMQVAEYA